MIDESVPSSWFQGEGFTHSRKLLLIFWLVMANFILLGYKGTLLTNLVQIQYESPIQFEDVKKLDLKILMPKFPGWKQMLADNPHLNRVSEHIMWHGYHEIGYEWYEQR